MKRTIQIGKQSLSLFLAVLMVVFTLPLSVFANELNSNTELPAEDYSVSFIKDIFEVEELRDETVKHFRLEDGSYIAAQYDKPVHYLDENGEWQDIDNTLAESGSEISTGNARVKFAKKITGNEAILTLHENNRKITLSLDGAIKKTKGTIINSEDDDGSTKLQKMMSLENLTAKVLYEDILDGVDLEYIVDSYDIKENIIVKEKADAYSYTFTMQLSNLSAALDENGQILLNDSKTGEAAYVIPAPIAYDANEVYADDALLYYTLVDNGNGKYSLTVNVDAHWMNSADRAYPVVVDPTVGVLSDDVTDLYIQSDAPDTSFSGTPRMYVNENKVVYWKTSSLPYIPASAYITNANISLYSTGDSGDYIGVYQVLTDWDSTLTWNKTLADEPQGSINAFPIDYNCIDGTTENTNRYNWNITPTVRGWYGGTIANYGIAFQIVSGTTPSSDNNIFMASEHSNGPQFTVSYKDMKGVEAYWTFGTQNAGFAGTGNINYATGNLTFSKSLLSTTDSLMAYSPAFVYNSALANDEYKYPNAEVSYWGAYMPLGFKLSINETIINRSYITVDGEDLDMYILSDADGTEHYFLPVDGSDGTIFQDEDGLQLILERNGSDLTITDNAQNVRYYTHLTRTPDQEIFGGWYLSSIVDSSGNKVVFDFNSSWRPTKVSIIPNGEAKIPYLEIVYNSMNMPYIIWNETAQEAMLFRYSSTYNGAISTAGTKYLRRIEYVHLYDDSDSAPEMTLAGLQAFYNGGTTNSNLVVGASAEYTYDSNGNLTIAKDNLSSYEIEYTYNNKGKITNVQEYGDGLPGQELSYTYRTGYTIVRSSGSDDILDTNDDLITKYMFDEEGRVVSMYSTDQTGTQIYGATAGVYEKQDNVKNNLKSTVVMGGSTSNYLLNGGFENSTSNSADHWSTSSGNVSFVQSTVIGGGDKMAKFAVNANSVASISQSTFLKAGEYTLSASIIPPGDDNVKLFMKARSLSDSANVYVEEVPLNKKYVDGHSDFGTMTFASEGENFEISFIVECGDISYTNVSVSVDNVMLEENIGASDYSMVQYGNFEAFNINSSGTAVDNLADYWTYNNGALRKNNAGNTFGTALYVKGYIDKESYISQTVYTAPDEYKAQYDSNPLSLDLEGKTFIVSGFATGAGQSYSENSRFGLRVEVTYYLGANEYLTIPEYFAFEPDCIDWQFVCGSFDTQDGALISRIDVYCDFSYQQDGFALFDEIALFESYDDSVVKYTYYLNGLLQSRATGYGIEEYGYNNMRQVAYVANDRGEVTEYGYYSDEVTVKHELSYCLTANNTDVPATKTDYFYNDYGQMTESSTVEGEVYIEDGVRAGEFESPHTARCLVNTREYITNSGSHIFGALSEEVDTLGICTQYFYDETNGRLLAAVNPDKETGTCYTYDAIGNITSVLPVTMEDFSDYAPVNNSNSVEYTYNSANLLESIITESTEYNFEYDFFGNTDSVSIGNNEIVSYEYNDYNGKLNTIHYANGFSVEYVYDRLENLSEVWYTEDVVSTKAYEYHYTAYGQLARFDNLLTGKSISYKYDDENRLIGFIEYDTDDATDVFSSTVFYDDRSRTSEVRYFLETVGGTRTAKIDVRYEYLYDDPEGLLDKYVLTTANNLPGEISYTYDGLKRMSEKTTLIGSPSLTQFIGTFSYSYVDPDDLNAITTLLVKEVVSQVNFEDEVTTTYEYDFAGNITKITLSNGQEYRYVYDDLGQLVREDNTEFNKTYVYTYDNAGNILKKYTYALTAAGVTPANPISTYNYGYTDADWADKLTSYRGVGFTYDEIGNPLTYYNGSNYSFTWENGRQLAALTKGSNSLSFEYNDDGIRTSKTVNGVEHVYHLNGSQIIAEEWADNLLVYIYDADGTPIGMQHKKPSYPDGAFDSYWFEKNLQGDIVAVYDDLGYKLVSYTYDAWGNCTVAYENGGASTIAANNPFRYRGYYYDTETGFYYLNGRYYDPVIGRFISPDNVALLGANGDFASYNLYSYCGNNPISRVDSNGHFWEAIVIGFAVGVVGQYVSDVIGNIKNGETGIEIFKSTSSTSDYLAAGVGGAIAAIPGLNLVGTIAVGAVGSVVSDSIKGNINSWEDLGKSALKGGVANGIGYGVSKAMAALKVKQISNMPRFARKQYLRDEFYCNSQADVNVNLKNFANSSLGENIAIVEKQVAVFRAGIYSTVTSTIATLY